MNRRRAWIVLGAALLALVVGLLLVLRDGAAESNERVRWSDAAPESVHRELALESGDAGAAPARSIAPVDPAERAPGARAGSDFVEVSPWMRGRITVRVVGGADLDEPRAGILVRARAREATGFEGFLGMRETRSDERGVASFDGLRAGAWIVDGEAGRAGGFLTPVVVELDRDARPEASVELRIVEALEWHARLLDPSGRLLDLNASGLPVALHPLVAVRALSVERPVGAAVRASDTSMARVVDASPRGARNEFRVHARPGEVAALAAVFHDVVLDLRVVSGVPARVDLHVDPDELARTLTAAEVLVVRAQEGSPVAGARIETGYGAGSVSATTDAAGLARIAGLPHGATSLEVRADGHLTTRVGLDLPQDRPLRIELVAARRISGSVVVGEEGGAIGFAVQAFEVRDASARIVDIASATVGVDRGARTFSFLALAPGTYVVAVQRDFGLSATGEDVRAGRVPGAAWVDVTWADAAGVVLTAP